MSKEIGAVQTEESLVKIISTGHLVKILMNGDLLCGHKKSGVDSVSVAFIDFLYWKTKELESIENLIDVLQHQRDKAIQDINKRLENEYGHDPTPEYRCPSVY